MKGRKLGLIYTLLSGAAWATAGLCGQFLFEHRGISPNWLVPAKMTIGGLILVALAVARDGKRVFSILREFPVRMAIYAFCGMAVCQYSYMAAIACSNAATGTVLNFIGRMFIIVYVTIATRKLPGKYEVIALLAAFAGVVLIATQGNPRQLAMSPQALFWGLLSAAGFAVYSVVPGRMLKGYSSMAVSGLGMFIGGLPLMLFFRAWQVGGVWNTGTYAGLAGVILVGTVLAFIFYLEGIKRIGSSRAGMLSASEPVVSTIISALMMGVSFSVWDILGFACIISTVFLLHAESVRQEGSRAK